MAQERKGLELQEDLEAEERNLPRFCERGLETEEKVFGCLGESPFLYERYQSLNGEWKRRFLDFCQGKKSLPLTYDPFFKRIFHPDIHPDRLSRLISSILGIRVRVLRILPSEESLLEGGTLLIMDLLGELEDGSLINVEIQKQGYAFPAERITCYSADLILRQYARAKGIKGKAFTYRDIKKVYVIVLFEKSTAEFHKVLGAYVHHGKTTFDTDLKMEFLQEYYLIALDVFRKFPYAKDRNELTAWLSLLTTEDIEEVEKLVLEYPWLGEIYEEIAELRQRPEEVLGMFSEALRILDENTVKYMIEELQKEVEEKETVIEEKNAQIVEQNAALEEKDVVLKEKDIALRQKDVALKEKDMEIEALRRQLRNQENT